MLNLRSNLPLKVGLVLASLSWLSYIFYDFNIGIYSRHFTYPGVIEDIPAVWGLGFRIGAAAIAVIIVLLFVLRHDLSKIEAKMALRLLIIFEALYFLSFIGGVLNFGHRNYFASSMIADRDVPTFVVSIALPIVLFKLFTALNQDKPQKEGIKWALIYASTFIFTFWINNAGEWIGTVILKGANYLLQYPVNLLSFTVTVVGLLLLFFASADFTNKWIKLGTLQQLDLRKISAILTLLGLYSLFIFLLWLFFGSVGGWGVWYAWFLGHGYMSFIALPICFITIPLLFRTAASDSSQDKSSLKLTRKQLDPIIYFTQLLGIIFWVIFSLAYYIPIPTKNFLIGTQPYLWTMQLFGTLFLIAALALTILSFRIKVAEESD